MLHIQIVNSKGLTVASKGELTFGETQIGYSDQTIVNYLGESVDIISLVEVNRDYISSGAYKVYIYIEDKLAGATQFTLK